MESSAPGSRWVDLHPLANDDDGTARQAALDGTWHTFDKAWFTTGTVGGIFVLCVSAEAQRLFHSGYEPRADDVHDVSELNLMDG
jgi:lincosamide nucleotidyltransferase A/C/D/E